MRLGSTLHFMHNVTLQHLGQFEPVAALKRHEVDALERKGARVVHVLAQQPVAPGLDSQ